MRKKERVAAIAVLAVVAVIVLAAVAMDQEQQRQHVEAKAAAEAEEAARDAKRTYSQGETVHISSDDESAGASVELQGSMELTVLEAKLYDSYEATGLPTGDGHFYGSQNSPGNDSCFYLVCVTNIKNNDAVPTQEAKSGERDFVFGGPKANAAEFVYFDGSKENSPERAVNCFAIAPGEEKTLTACWQIPQSDGLSNLPESVTLELLGYLVKLAPVDCRRSS